MSRDKPWAKHLFNAHPRFPRTCVKCGMPTDHPNHFAPAVTAAAGRTMEAKPPERPTASPESYGLKPDPSMFLKNQPATGNMCSDCGGIMRRTGACETCESCGSNTGCG